MPSCGLFLFCLSAYAPYRGIEATNPVLQTSSFQCSDTPPVVEMQRVELWSYTAVKELSPYSVCLLAYPSGVDKHTSNVAES